MSSGSGVDCGTGVDRTSGIESGGGLPEMRKVFRKLAWKIVQSEGISEEISKGI